MQVIILACLESLASTLNSVPSDCFPELFSLSYFLINIIEFVFQVGDTGFFYR